ncbi:Zn-dependent hydrolase [Ethanoligenens sp.]|uniref:Zn-dependent hydrolase n=1 Tax=Ethanoligenens sp. TaxID=2099655 RepID=UPI0039E8393B
MKKYNAQLHGLQINRKRMDLRLKELSVFGGNSTGGIDRNFGSQADLQARRWLLTMWEKAGLEVRVDAAANLWAQRPGMENLPPIVFGSHHDTVPNGGAYDGAAGVILATEVAQCLIENDIRLRHPFSVISFTGEEPNPFGVSTLGSKLLTGKLLPEQMAESVNSETGESLADALAHAGGNFSRLVADQCQVGDLAAFVECHIEQGRVLESCGRPLGIVREITGIYRETIHIIGDANHAGTTLLADRHDALLAASELVLALEEVVLQSGRNDLVGTVGRISVYPNSTNIIPGDVKLILELRSPDRQAIDKALLQLEPRLCEVIHKRDVHISRKVLYDQPPVPMSEQVQQILGQAVCSLKETAPFVTSMAGHDAGHITSIAPTGMLFVRTPNGHSHCPRERADLDDLQKAGDTLLTAVLMLDEELD